MLKTNSKVKIEWVGYYHEMTKSKLKEIKEDWSNKLGIDKKNITIEKTYKQNVSDVRNVSNVVLDSVLDPTKLKENYKKFVLENYPEEDFNKFLEIDEKVSNQIENTDDFDTRDRSYEIISVRGKNIFSYGFFERNYIDSGATLIYSETPYENGGGKSSLVRMPAFLLFGNNLIYGHKKASYDRVFNKFTEDSEAYIEGEIKINDEIYYLRRNLKKSKSGKVSHKFYICKLDSGGELIEEIGKIGINLNKKDSIQTLKKFEKVIGTYDDYTFAAYYEYHNIEKWLQTKSTQRYRLFCEYLGLGIIETKNKIVKDLLSEHIKTSISSKYDVESLLEANLAHSEKSLDDNVRIEKGNKLILETKTKIDDISNKLKILYSKRHGIDSKFENFSLEESENKLKRKNLELDEVGLDIKQKIERLSNFESIYTDIENKKKYSDLNVELKNQLKNIGMPLEYSAKIKSLESSIDALKVPEEYIQKITSTEKSIELLNSKVAVISSEINSITIEIDELPLENICKKCGNIEDTAETKQLLSEKIKSKEELLSISRVDLKQLKQDLVEAKANKVQYTSNKVKEIRLEIAKQKNLAEVEINKAQSAIYSKIDANDNNLNLFNEYEKVNLSLKNSKQRESAIFLDIKILTSDIFQYNANKSKIDDNKRIGEQVYEIEKEIKVLNLQLSKYNVAITDLEKNIALTEYKISENLSLITKINADYEYEKSLRLYAKVHGDDGISKHIILSIIPQINGDLSHLMKTEMELDFELSINFDDKKIDFVVEKDGVRQDLNDYSGWETTISCLALHYINVKMTTLPLPNYLVLDEVLSRMNRVNFAKIAKMLVKLGEVFTTIDVITHSHIDELKKHISNTILITKENHISKIK